MSDIEAELNAEFDAWFEKLQAISNVKLKSEDWTERWYDGYSPEEALLQGPDDD